MKNPIQILVHCIPIFLMGSAFSIAEIRISAQGCNNQYGKDWVMTASPEIAMTWKWFGIGFDGSFATYTPRKALQNYVLQTRISFFPMLRIPLRRFFVETGYGVSQMFRREQFLNPVGEYRFESDESIRGEFRASGGLSVRLNNIYSMILRGGFAWQGKENSFFFASAGIGFGAPIPVRAADPGFSAGDDIEMINPAAISLPAAFQNVSVISEEDDISTELNAAVQAALIREGLQVTSWDKIKTVVQDDFLNRAKTANPKALFASSSLDSLTRLQIAFLGAKLLPLDAIVETNLRYYYKVYGGDIVVESATVRLTEASSGKIVWSVEYDSSDPTLSGCKQRLISDLIKAIRSAPRRRQ